jgi:hypothetical protein
VRKDEEDNFWSGGLAEEEFREREAICVKKSKE